MTPFATIYRADNGWTIHFPARGATVEHTFINPEAEWVIGVLDPIMSAAEAPPPETPAIEGADA